MPRRPVEIVYEGHAYTGDYVVESGTVRVTYKLHSRSTQLGGHEADGLARMLLRELVQATIE